MKLVEIGGYGYLVDPKALAQLKTVAEVDEQLNQLAAGLVDPVERTSKEQRVVDGNSYVQYLGQLKASIEAKKQRELKQAQQNTQQARVAKQASGKDLPKTKTDGDVLRIQAKMNDEIAKRDDIIARLLKFAKEAQSAKPEVEAPKVYTGAMPQVAGPEALSLASNTGSLLQVLADGDTDKMKAFGNAAILRGIVGDDQAKLIIDNDFGEGTFDSFLNVLGG